MRPPIPSIRLQSGELAVNHYSVKIELVTTLKRRATQIIASPTENRDPILITQHGCPAAYLVDVETYEGMNDRLTILEIIGHGERGLQEGRIVPHQKARQRMSRWLK